MAGDLIRIFSDLHFGDRSSRVRRLAQIRPLLSGAARIVLNGDSLDTRSSPQPHVTAALREEVRDFFRRDAPPTTFLTGNHDPDISTDHTLDLAAGKVFVVHGDVLFETIVPWSRDAELIGRLIAGELAALPPSQQRNLHARLAVWRKIAARIPQRHESERNAWKHAFQLLADTVWPPKRIFRILGAWRVEPGRAAALLREHRPGAKFIVTGHTHRPNFRRLRDGIVTINTGAFGVPFGGWCAELTPTHIRVRPVRARRGEFRLADPIAEFPL